MTKSISLPGFMIKLFIIQKIHSKMFFISYAKTHHDVITLKIDGMV